MSKPIETNGTPDLAAECATWEKQCAELIEDRERLRAELAKAQAECEVYRKSLFHQKCKDYMPPNYTKKEQEEALVHLDDKLSILDLIAEFDNAPASP
jgi:hypothetical protein